MILRAAPALYNQADQAGLREALRRADRDNLKRDQDIALVAGRLILTAPGGGQWVVQVDDAGALSATAL